MLRRVVVLLAVGCAAARDVFDDAESLLQMHVERAFDHDDIDEMASDIGDLIANTVLVTDEIYRGVIDDFLSAGVNPRSLGDARVSLLETGSEGDEDAVLDEDTAVAEEANATKEDNAFMSSLFKNIASAVSENVVTKVLTPSPPPIAEQAKAEVPGVEAEDEVEKEAPKVELREEGAERATAEDEDEDIDDQPMQSMYQPAALSADPLMPSDQLLQQVPQDGLARDPLLDADLSLPPLAPLAPAFPPVYESQFKVADERPLRPGEMMKPEVIPLNPVQLVEEQPLLRSEEAVDARDGIQYDASGAPVEYFKMPSADSLPPPESYQTYIPKPVEEVAEPVEVRAENIDAPVPELIPEEEAQPVERAEPEVEPEKPMGYYEEDLVRRSDLPSLIGLRAVPVKSEMYAKPYTLPEMPKLRLAEGDESTDVKSIDDRWLRSARTRATQWAAKAAVKTAGFAAGNAVKHQLEQRLNPFLMAVDKYIEQRIENTTRKLNLDVNLRTLRTSQALSDACVAVWQNLTGVDNAKAKENAIYRLIDELQLQNQPPSAKFRLLYGIDRALRGHAHHLGDATYTLFSRFTEEQLEKKLAERVELLGKRTITEAKPHDGGNNPLWRGSRVGRDGQQDTDTKQLHKWVKELEKAQQPQKL